MKYILSLTFMLATFAFCNSIGEQFFMKGNEEYHKANYAQALENYKQALSNKFIPPELYFNLGNTYYKLGSLGMAIANYKIAKSSIPRDRELINNLEKTQQQVQDNVSYPKINPAIKTLLIPLYFFGLDEILWIFAGITSIISLFLIIGVCFNAAFAKKYIPLLLILWIFAAIPATYYIWNFYNHSSAVVCVSEAPLFSGPADSYTKIASLRDGCEVKVLDTIGDWTKIAFITNEKYETAWIKNSDIFTVYTIY